MIWNNIFSFKKNFHLILSSSFLSAWRIFDGNESYIKLTQCEYFQFEHNLLHLFRFAITKKKNKKLIMSFCMYYGLHLKTFTSCGLFWRTLAVITHTHTLLQDTRNTGNEEKINWASFPGSCTKYMCVCIYVSCCL